MKAHIRNNAVPLDNNSYVGTFKDLLQLKTVTGKVNRYAVGEVVYVEDQEKMYMFDGYDWKPIEAKSDGTGLELSLFDMNAQIIKQQGPLNEEGMKKAEGVLEDYFNFSSKAKYYMLLNHKKSYYTVFNITDSWDQNFETFSSAVLSCASDLGKIYSVARTEDNQAIEIWVCDEDDTIHCLYLFNYDKGIVKVKS